MKYDLEDLIVNAHIDVNKFDEEVEQNSGKAAWIGSLLSNEETRYEKAKVRILALEGKKYEEVVATLTKELPKSPTISQVDARLNQDPELFEARLKVAEIKGNLKKLSTLFSVYDKRFGMLQSRGANLRKEFENVKTGI